MACEEPRPAWRPLNGGPLRWSPPTNDKAWKAFEAITIPCGICLLCRDEQARQWAVRITHEASLHEESSFLTLTYNDEHLPRWGSLNYEHLHKFWKRLRKTHGPIRYYACGEYGDESLRPHYHACIFGQAYTKDRIIVQHNPHLLWVCPELTKAWGHGDVKVGALTFQTARYTASYVTKKLRSKQQFVRVDENTGELIPLVQPRPFMSRNIAKDWWLNFGHQVKHHDYVVINGQRQKPPKAYDRWLNETEPKTLEKIKQKRKEHIEPATAKSKDNAHARAKNAHARARSKTKLI